MRFFTLSFLFVSLLFLLNCDTTSSNTNNGTLVGSSPVLHVLGEDTTYFNSGFVVAIPVPTALDAEDGNLTDSIIKSYYCGDTINCITQEKFMDTIGVYFVKYSVTDSDGNTAVKWKCLILKPVENNGSKPVITLVGDTLLIVKSLNSYIEPGFSCYDEEDGDISDSVKVDFLKEDKATAFTFNSNNNDSICYVKYSVVDSHGNYDEKWRMLKESSNYISISNPVLDKDTVKTKEFLTVSIKVESSSNLGLGSYLLSFKDSLGNKTFKFDGAIEIDDDIIDSLTITFMPLEDCQTGYYTGTLLATDSNIVATKEFSFYVLLSDSSENIVSYFPRIKIMAPSASGASPNNCSVSDALIFSYAKGKADESFQSNCDLVYYYMTSAIFCAPSAVPSQINSGYSEWGILNNTTFTKANSSNWELTDTLNDSGIVSVSGVSSNQTDDLSVGDIYGFKTTRNKMGLFKVIDLDPGYESDKYITIAVKIQN